AQASANAPRFVGVLTAVTTHSYSNELRTQPSRDCLGWCDSVALQTMYKGAAVIRFTTLALLFSTTALLAGCLEDDKDLSGQLESDLAPGQSETSSEALATGNQEQATASLCFDTPKVAVIGAGATGLTAAYLLGEQGYDRVTVFEKDAEVGGFARTRVVN